MAQKIFCIGAHKTGTSSIAKALNMLGFPCAHHHQTKDLRQKLQDGCSVKVLFDKHAAFADLPIPQLFKELDSAYSDSLFILSVRDPEDWISSVYRWMNPQGLPRGLSYEEQQFYGTDTFDKQHFLDVYHSHNESVRSYFSSRSDSLLELNIWEDDPWNELCPFLGVNVPSCMFPKITPKQKYVFLQKIFGSLK